jgi:hypothetical protein
MIKIVDRLGKTHKVNELVYAYFDTLTEKYIVLDKHPEISTPTIYGKYYKAPVDSFDGYIKVEYATGIDETEINNAYAMGLDRSYYISDKLGLTSNLECEGIPAIAIRMNKLD